MPEPQHAEVFTRRRARFLGSPVESPDIPIARAANEAGTAIDRHRREVGRESDTPRVKQSRAAACDEIEDAASLLEEPASLRKEQRKAIEIHLLIVRLDLREVRVRREVH